MLAHPYASFLSPSFIPILIFGELIGVKINILLFLFLGMFGMYLLSKELGNSGFARFLPGIVFMGSSCYPLKVLLGHFFEINMALMPWIFLFYLKSLQEKKNIIFASIVFSFAIGGGSVEIPRFLILFLPFYGILKSLQTRDFKPLRMITFLFVITFLLTAIKTFPMLEFFLNNKKVLPAGSGVSWSVIKEMLFNRNHFDLHLNFLSDWLERGSYIGVASVILALIGVCYKMKERWPLLITGVFVLPLIMVDKFPINIWGLLHRFFPFYSMHIPGRLILIFILVLALFSGFGLGALERGKQKFRDIKKILVGCIFLFIILDLYLSNAHIFSKIFIASPPAIKKDKEFAQYKNIAPFSFQRNALYPLFLKNKGAVEGFGIVSLKRGKVRFKSYSDPTMQYWAIKEYLHTDRPKAEFIDFPQIDSAHLSDKDAIKIDGWQIVRPLSGLYSKTHQISFAEKSPKNSNWHLGYILFYVYSPFSRNGTVKAGGVAGITLWVNEEKVIESFGMEAKRKGVKIEISLKKGWNSFLFGITELAHEYKSWGMHMDKITDAQGAEYTDLRYDVFKGAIEISESEDIYRGEAYLLNNPGAATLNYFSPNKLIIHAQTENPDILLVNQNYHHGWKAIKEMKDKAGRLKVFSHEGILGVKLPRGAHTIVFYFLPTLFIFGTFVSILTFLCCILYLKYA